MNAAQKIYSYGTSIWYDNFSRDLLENGELKKLVENYGVRGITSNPTIFEKAFSTSPLYKNDIATLKAKGHTPGEIFDELATIDIGLAADTLRGVYEESCGADGCVSIEVSPTLSNDCAGTVKEALKLFAKLDRPNIMIKVPGTPAGMQAVYQLLLAGVNINITLLFSVENYIQVAEIYCQALEARIAKGLPVDRIASVASFFVSRVDSAFDALLDGFIATAESSDKILAQSLKGKIGIANCRLAYAEFERIFTSERFARLARHGARVQRPLWASTGVKDPKYVDTLYVDELIGPDTVNTMPPQTLKAFADHGNVATTLRSEMSAAYEIKGTFARFGFDLPKVFQHLQDDGIQKFKESFEKLLAVIGQL